MHRGANLIVDLKRISTREMRFDWKGRGGGREKTKTFRAFIFIRVPRKIFWIDLSLLPNYGIGFHRSVRARIVTNGYINREFCKRISRNCQFDSKKYALHSILKAAFASRLENSRTPRTSAYFFLEKEKTRKETSTWNTN